MPTAFAATGPTPTSNRWTRRMEGEVEVAFEIDSLELVEGTYKLDVAVHTPTAIRTTTTACSTPSA